MLSELMNFLRACFQSSSDRYGAGEIRGRQDGLLWYKDSGQHLNGDFSMSVIQANNLLEDQSQIESGSLSLQESGPRGTFVGVYDGHGGPETSRYICDHLFQHLKSETSTLCTNSKLRTFLLQLYIFCSFLFDHGEKGKKLVCGSFRYIP